MLYKCARREEYYFFENFMMLKRRQQGQSNVLRSAAIARDARQLCGRVCREPCMSCILSFRGAGDARCESQER